MLTGLGYGRQKGTAQHGDIRHIARLVGDRGFGFIRDERGQELFFHATSVEGAAFEELHEGQSVEFERERDTRGRGDRAAHVRPATA